MVNKEIVKKNFSRCAPYYDKYSTIQNLCALKLITKAQVNELSKVLEIGCGTGNYTKLLRHRFPIAQIKAIDISREMVEIAKEKLGDEGIEFVIADAETEDFAEQFDLITSNVSFQWFEDLEKALMRYRNLLNENGIISFSLFGPFTFYELNESLRELWGKYVSITSCNFMGKRIIEEALKWHFNEITVEEEMIKEQHNSLLELFNKIKYTGTRGNGANAKILWTPKTINRLEEVYKARFGGIIATYQILFCQAMRGPR